VSSSSFALHLLTTNVLTPPTILSQSYGGFLTTKVIEANSSVFQLGMAVAPVTDWRYYDSVYTERYMSTPQLNKVGYENSSVTEMDGFNHAHYALAHGSGDDNVHYQNTAALLDKFTVTRVR
jgi:dipeptidyl aminopeptidase